MEHGERLSELQYQYVEHFVYRHVICMGKNYTEVARELAKTELGIELSQQSIKNIAEKKLAKIHAGDPDAGDRYIHRTIAFSLDFAVPDLTQEWERSKQAIETTEWRSVGGESEEEMESLTGDEVRALAQRGDKKTSQKIFKIQGRIGDSSQLKVALDYFVLAGRLLGFETKAMKTKALEKAAEAMNEMTKILNKDNESFDLKGGEEKE